MDSWDREFIYTVTGEPSVVSLVKPNLRNTLLNSSLKRRERSSKKKYNLFNTKQDEGNTWQTLEP